MRAFAVESIFAREENQTVDDEMPHSEQWWHVRFNWEYTGMTTRAKEALDMALGLPAIERAALADEILNSLDQPDPILDKMWIVESERRFDACVRGEMALISEEEVFEKLDRM